MKLVAGISQQQLGMITFDAEIAADGETLFLVDGKFSGGEAPDTADLSIALREVDAFRRWSESSRLFKNINTRALEYAPAISSDLRELCFTRYDRADRSGEPAIFCAARKDIGEPFGKPEKLPLSGFIEAPTLSPNGELLYYHKREKGRFAIYRAIRKRPT